MLFGLNGVGKMIMFDMLFGFIDFSLGIVCVFGGML